MSFVLVAAALLFLVLLFTLFVRSKDIPEPIAASPFQHLEGRRAAIYENLRDLQFEYRVGKLSDDDYQRTKKELQAELAGVLAEIDRLKEKPVVAPAPGAQKAKQDAVRVCAHCGAKFDKPLKFCGECGKAMAESA